jgi:stage IV sporulation protein FB
MRWSYTIARIAGTEVKVHVTFLLLLGWIAYDVNAEAGAGAAAAYTLFFVAFFCCILLHEFGHISMARRFGVRTPDVILLPIGGVARLERIPEDPGQELLVALAGPAVTLALILALFAAAAGVLGSAAGVVHAIVATSRGLFTDESITDPAPLLVHLLVANAMVLGFNLIPAFPLDGGRVLRSLLARRLGLARGTRIAGAIGPVFAVGLGVFGFVQSEPVLLLVAFFIFVGAGTEAGAVATRLAGRGLTVSHMMVTDFRTIPVHAPLQQAVDLLLAGEQREFPVVDNLGRTEGILTRDNLIRGLSRLGPGATVAEAMTSAAPTLPPTLGFQEALDRLRGSGLPALPVVDAGGRLVGLLTRDNITDLLLVRGARR